MYRSYRTVQMTGIYKKSNNGKDNFKNTKIGTLTKMRIPLESQWIISLRCC